jgi:hypothetical protein
VCSSPRHQNIINIIRRIQVNERNCCLKSKQLASKEYIRKSLKQSRNWVGRARSEFFFLNVALVFFKSIRDDTFLRIQFDLFPGFVLLLQFRLCLAASSRSWDGNQHLDLRRAGRIVSIVIVYEEREEQIQAEREWKQT